MRKISLDPYEYEGQPYDVKGSMVSLLFSPHLKLGYRQAFENERVARKIEAGNGSVLLEESEYGALKRSVETFEGYGRPDIEFINRVIEAPEVQVGEV